MTVLYLGALAAVAVARAGASNGFSKPLDQLLDDLAALAGGIRAVKAVERVLLDGNGRAGEWHEAPSTYERNTVLLRRSASVNGCVVRGHSGASGEALLSEDTGGG